MEFKYYYQITQEQQSYRRRIKLGTIGHIILDKETDKFLCGKKRPELKYHGKPRNWALPGYKLCEDCTTERYRLVNHLPKKDNLSNWWSGGREAHKKEVTNDR